MNHETYPCSIRGDFLEFEFTSEGPKGKIRKVIQFQPRISGHITYYNLGFGDYDPDTDIINDLVRSNNLDRAKILATVALCILEFSRHFPETFVFATGSTPARTRLYQIGIATNWAEINSLLYVFGYHHDREWEPFQKNISYDGFLVRRKLL